MSTMNEAADAGRFPVLADFVPPATSRARTLLDSALLVIGGTLFVALLAQVTIPHNPVPVTGQTLGVILVGAALGWKKGMLSMALYLVLGLFLPIYAQGSEGTVADIGTVAGASGGYIVGFVFAAGAVGWLAERGQDRKVLTAFVSFVAGQLIIFAFGLIGLKMAAPELVELGVFANAGWGTVIHEGFTIFIVVELIKAAIAAVLMPVSWKILNVQQKDRG